MLALLVDLEEREQAIQSMTTWRASSCVANRRPWTQAVFGRRHRLSVCALS